MCVSFELCEIKSKFLGEMFDLKGGGVMTLGSYYYTFLCLALYMSFSPSLVCVCVCVCERENEW